MSHLKKKLKEIIKTIDDLYLNKDILDASEDTLLKELGIDSLGRINLFYGIIDHFGIEVDEKIASGWNTLGDVLDFIEDL